MLMRPNQALDVAWPLTSCARTVSLSLEKGLIRSTIQRDSVAFAAWVNGRLGRINSPSEVLMVFVLSIYHFNALTGQYNLSSVMEDPDDMVGRNISPDALTGS